MIILIVHATTTKTRALQDTMTAVAQDIVLCQPINRAATDVTLDTGNLPQYSLIA